MVLPFTMDTLVEVPFWGPQTRVKSSLGVHWKSEGACSPSTTKTTLNRSESSTILCTSTRMVDWAHPVKATHSATKAQSIFS